MRILCLVISFLPVVISAQFSIGQRFGTSYSTWHVAGDTERADSWNSRLSGVWGKSVEIPISMRLFGKGKLHTGLSFNEKGYREGEGTFSRNLRFNYLQVPLSIGRTFNAGQFEFEPSFGALIGFNVRGRGWYGWNDGLSFSVGRINDSGWPYPWRIPDHEIALLGRMSFAYLLKKNALVLDISYQHGLSNVMFDVDFMDNTGQTLPALTATHRSFTLQLGYRIDPVEVIKRSTTEEDTTVVSRAPRVRFGHRGGITLSRMDFDGTLAEENQRVRDGSEELLGMTAAWVVDINLSDRLSLRPEIAYMQKGWRAQWYPRPSIGNDMLRMNYIELPIAIHYRMLRSAFSPTLSAGPVIGRGIGGRWNYILDSPSLGPLPISEVPVFSRTQWGYAPIDISLFAGIGCSIRHRSTELYLDIRYQHSLTNFYEGKRGWLYSETVEVYHRNWKVNVGYLLPW